jgi:hypothetical protein
LELAIHIEKRVMVRRGILPNDRNRQPTIVFDERYGGQMDWLIESVVALAQECRQASGAGVGAES